MLRRKLGLRMFLRMEVRVTLAPTWYRSTTHTARTRRLPTSLSRLLPSRRRRQQTPKEVATRAVMGDISQETIQIVQTARQRLILGQDPRMST